MIYWYHYYSYWIFIWFILYKIKIIKYQPSFNYILASLFVTMCMLLSVIKHKNNNPEIYKIYLVKSVISLITDYIPIYFLLPFKLDTTTFYINLVVFIIYLLFMKLSLNYNIYDIINMYISRIYDLKNITFKEWLRELSNFFLL